MSRYDEMMEEYVNECFRIDDAIKEMEEWVGKINRSIDEAQESKAKVMKNIENLIQENGVCDDLVAGEEYDTRVHYSNPRGRVVIADKDAIPEKFVRTSVTTEPDKLAIREYLKENKVNWAKMEYPEPVLKLTPVNHREE